MINENVIQTVKLLDEYCHDILLDWKVKICGLSKIKSQVESDKLNIDAKATYFSQEVTNRSSTVGAQGLLGYVYKMPRNIITNDLRDYQMDNPATPADYGVITYSDNLTGNPYWMTLHDKNVVRRNRFMGFVKINYEFTKFVKIICRNNKFNCKFITNLF